MVILLAPLRLCAQDPARDPYIAGWLGAKLVKPESGGSGIVVKEVAAGGPAEAAGLQAKDVIAQIDGLPVNDVFRFLTEIKARDPGTSVKLLVLRGADSRELAVTLGGMRIRPALDAAVARGLQWLMSVQREDGSWNTASPELVEGYVKASPRNTALIVLAVSSLPPAVRAPYAARMERALDALERATSPAGWVGDPQETIRWQNYATAFAAQAVAQLGDPKRRPLRDRWVAYLQKAQLLEANRVTEFDWYYGAWNYYDELRRSNLRGDTSVTAMVVDALVACGANPNAPELQKALAFVRRCQNFEPQPDLVVPLDDGGFFFNPRNSKAGEVVLPGNRTRFRSYGSATCDGLRTLLRLGVSRSDPRVLAAHAWLAKNYTVRENPGFPPGLPLPYYSGIFYYYYWGLTRALDAFGAETVVSPDGTVHYWARETADWLANLQKPDGSWANEVNIMEENDPLVATPIALIALAMAQKWVK